MGEFTNIRKISFVTEKKNATISNKVGIPHDFTKPEETCEWSLKFEIQRE